MGLLDKIESKLSGNKNNTTENKLQHEGVDSSKQHGNNFTGEGSHLSGTNNTPGSYGGVHGTTGAYGANTASTTTGSGIGGTHSGSHVPGTSTTGGTSGIAGGTHPLVTGEQGLRRDEGLTGNGVGGTHTGSNLAGSHGTHTGTGAGIGIVGGPAVGSHAGHHTGSSVGQGTHHSTARTPVDPFTSKGQRAMADAHEGHHHHTATQDTDFVPGSHPAAQNPSAIPTAGGERVGSIPGGNGSYDNDRAHDNRTTTEKIKDKVIPSRNDRPDDPVTGENYAQTSHPSHTGSHNTHDGVGSTAGSHGTTTGSHGLTGSHNTTTGSHGLTGSPNTTTGSHGLTGNHGTSAATPLAHDSGFNERHAGATTGAGLAGTGAGAGLASAGHHNTHDSRQQYTAGQQPAHDQYGSTNTSGINDNRSGLEKIKDKVIPSRTDRPDDPVTGQNYGQGASTSQQYTGTSGTTGSHVPGSTHHNDHGTSGFGGNHTYGSGVNDGGVSGVTHGVSNVGLGSNNNNTTGQY